MILLISLPKTINCFEVWIDFLCRTFLMFRCQSLRFQEVTHSRHQTFPSVSISLPSTSPLTSQPNHASHRRQAKSCTRNHRHPIRDLFFACTLTTTAPSITHASNVQSSVVKYYQTWDLHFFLHRVHADVCTNCRTQIWIASRYLTASRSLKMV